jgi:hypothetical protein
MITKFKIFEKRGDKFDIGTWVLLEQTLNRWNVYPYVKIIDKNSAKTHYNKYDEDDYEMPQNDYKIETFSLIEIGVKKEFWVDDSEIDRELTPEEIEDAKAKIDELKFNI